MDPIKHCDIIGCLFERDLHWFVENILIRADGRTVANCFQISKYWQRQLQTGNIWRRLLEKRFATDHHFRLLCNTNGWREFFPSKGGQTLDEKSYREMVYKATCYHKFWSSQEPRSSKLFTGGLFSCLALHDNFLFCGMLDGLIKMWNLKDQEKTKKVLKVFAGHEERVTSMDALDKVLVSGSMDHSIRVWDVQSNAMLRVLRGMSSGVLLVRLFPDRIVSWYRSGVMSIRAWTDRSSASDRPVNADHITEVGAVRLHEDTSIVNLVVGEEYVCMAPHDVYVTNEREVAVYCSRTGKRLQKDICASFPVQCMDLQGHLLLIGAGCTVEVWDVQRSQCLAVLGSNLRSNPSFYVRSLCVTDFMLVVMYSSGEMLHWQLQDIIRHPEKGSTFPTLRTLQSDATLIKNSEPPWKNMVLKKNRLIFGVEMKFGDIKMFTWPFNQQSEDQREFEEDSFERPIKSGKGMSHSTGTRGPYSRIYAHPACYTRRDAHPAYTWRDAHAAYRYDCKVDCEMCQDGDSEPLHIQHEEQDGWIEPDKHFNNLL